MTIRTSLAMAGAVALPLGFVATAGQAAKLVDTAAGMDQLKTFSDAIAAAGLEQQLSGAGPFTVFAPTDAAFQQLPQPILSKLLEEGHAAELTELLKHHVIDGQALRAKDVLGRTAEIETAGGDQLTVDGTDSVVLLIPAGVTVARSGDGGQSAEQTEVTADGNMPASEHQEEVLNSDVGDETRQTAPAGGMPATEHQKEVLGQDEGRLARQASVVEAEVTADNGVIHVIDAVLVPQSLRATLEQLAGGA
jgi:uncharacterized surface protein with fasciclin (FAS1) repeats